MEILEESVFAKCSNLINVFIPDDSQLIKIETLAFSYCDNLENITIPSEVTIIGTDAFSYCKNLQNIEIPSNVESIDQGAFYGCTNLSDVKLSTGLKTINNTAFAGCANLNQINIPEGVTDIGEKAFSGCSKMLKADIPSSVSKIEKGTFQNCTYLKEVNINGNNLTAIDLEAFSGCEHLEKINLPSSVKNMGYRVFYKCISLQELVLSDGLKNIGTGCFEECNNLKSIEIPNSVLDIGGKAFYHCNNLETAIIPTDSQITQIQYETFYGCSRLTEIKLPNSVKKVEYRAFNNCSILEKIEIPQSVIEISNDAFNWGKNVTIYGEADSYAEKYANKNNIPFKQIGVADPLEISLAGNHTTVNKREKVTLTATVKGGTPEYTYRYSIINKETGRKANLTGFVKNNTYVWTAANAGKRELFVEVKDASGNTVKSNSVNVVCLDDLSVKLTAPATEVKKGSTLKITAQATGGASGYTYRYSIINKETGRTAAMTGFVKNNTYTWTATNTGERELFVEVKDATGKIVKSNSLNIVCSGELSVKLTAPATEVKKGSTLKITAQATGGASGYTYRYSIINKETGRTAAMTGFVKNNTYTWTAANTGKRQLYVEVKDTTGKIVKSSAVNLVVK